MPQPSIYKSEATTNPGLSPGQATASGTFAQPEVSPTGAPVLPTAVVPWLVGVVLVAGALATSLPPNTIAAQACGIVFEIGGLLGLVSPGLRRQQ